MGPFRGVAAFFAGLGWVATTPRVWARAAVPVMTALVLVAALAALGVRGALKLSHRALGEGVSAGLLGVLLAVGAVLLAILVGVSLAQPLSGWALDGIVDAWERAHGVTPHPSPPRLSATVASFASAALGLAVGVPLIVLLTLVGWAFPPAAFATVPLKLVVASILLAWDLLDYPLAARGAGVKERLKWCARNLGAVVGFGLAAILFFAVPGLGLLALPCGVAGAARLVARESNFS